MRRVAAAPRGPTTPEDKTGSQAALSLAIGLAHRGVSVELAAR